MLGYEYFSKYVEKYDLKLDKYFDKIDLNYPQRSWTYYINKGNERTANAVAIDLLSKVLIYDFQVLLIFKILGEINSRRSNETSIF